MEEVKQKVLMADAADAERILKVVIPVPLKVFKSY